MDPKGKSPAELIAEIERLQGELGVSEKKRTDAEEMAHAMSSAGQFIARTAEEQATGKTVKVKVLLNPTESEKKLQKYKEVEYPTYFYTINLPPSGGVGLTTNGITYFHGETYEFDPIMLAEMPRYLACRHIERSELLAGRIGTHVRALMERPRPAAPDLRGAEIAAKRLLERLHRAKKVS